MGHSCGSGTCHKQENHYLRKLSSDWLTFENKRFQQQPYGLLSQSQRKYKSKREGKKIITHSFKLTMLNVHHVTVCMKCEQNILGLGIPPPIILSLTIFSVAAIFRSLHGSRVRSHCICASVRPAGSPPVSQIVILKTLFSF